MPAGAVSTDVPEQQFKLVSASDSDKDWSLWQVKLIRILVDTDIPGN